MTTSQILKDSFEQTKDKVTKLLAQNPSLLQSYLYHTYGAKSKLKVIFGEHIATIFNIDGSLKINLKFFNVEKLAKDLKQRSFHVRCISDHEDIKRLFSNQSEAIEMEVNMAHLSDKRMQEMGISDNEVEIMHLDQGSKSMNYSALQEITYQNFMWKDPALTRGDVRVIAQSVYRACVTWNKVV